MTKDFKIKKNKNIKNLNIDKYFIKYYHNLNKNNINYSYKNVDTGKLGFKNTNIKYLYLNPNNLSLNIFKEELSGMNLIKKGVIYGFLIKLRRSNETF